MPNKKKIKQTWEEKLTDIVEEEIYFATGDKSDGHFSRDCKMNEIIELVKQEKDKAKKDTAREIVKELQLGGWPETITVLVDSNGGDTLGNIHQITQAITSHYKL